MSAAVRFYQAIIYFGDFLKHFLLLFMRFYWGYSFTQAGLYKFSNIQGSAEFFQSLHIPFPLFNAYFVGGVETIGGICLILGLGSRLFALLLAFTMIVALLTASGKATWELIGAYELLFSNHVLWIAKVQKVVEEPPFNFLLVSLVIFCTGPGAISLDALLSRKFAKRIE